MLREALAALAARGARAAGGIKDGTAESETYEYDSGVARVGARGAAGPDLSGSCQKKSRLT